MWIGVYKNGKEKIILQVMFKRNRMGKDGGTGHLMPINADSIKISVVLNDSETKGAIRKTGITHFSTCPKADHHRKKGV